MPDLLRFTDKGIYCAEGDFYVDPWCPVARAVLTHAHADHARPGSRAYLATPYAQSVLRLRLGEDIHLDTMPYGAARTIGGVRVSFHPAGHIRGSAQVRVEHKGEVWVASGDYKTDPDGQVEPFEPVQCHAFITESTFGLPIYRWTPQAELQRDLNEWWRNNAARGLTTCVFGYSLGKAQRLLGLVDPSIGPIYVHGAVHNVNEALRADGMVLPDCTRVTGDMKKGAFEGALVVAPPSALNTPWMRRFSPYVTGYASGWMALRGARRRRAADRGFILSDHADWDGLWSAVRATGAERVFVTHGYKAVFARWLREQGLDAHDADTQYEGEQEESAAEAQTDAA
ncbi:MAG: ligase-associated DNA damage response exonuclease [Catalinimonas sp.]